MRRRQQELLEMLFPKVRARMLRLLFGVHTEQRCVRDLMSKSGLALSTVQDELRKLRAAGLIFSTTNGYRRFYHPDRNHPLFLELQRIVRLSEMLPAIDRSILHPKRRARRSAKQQRRPYRESPPYLPVQWHFSSLPKRT
jgi:predicted transcriptional regulator